MNDLESMNELGYKNEILRSISTSLISISSIIDKYASKVTPNLWEFQNTSAESFLTN